MKTLADYLNWRTPKADAPAQPSAGEWRPPVHQREYMYDKPQTRIIDALDKHPIIQRVLINPKVPAPRSFPIWGTPAYQFLAGLWTGCMLTMVFTCKPLGRKEVEDLVKYDPAYFPEFAKARS